MASKRGRGRSTDGRIDMNYFHYRIIAGQREGKCQAIAYVGRQKIDSVTGESVTIAVDTMKQSLDERLAHLRRQRVDGVPTEAEYREGLMALDTEMQEDVLGLLKLHGQRPGATASFGDMARLNDLEEPAIADTYARAGRRLGNLLNFSPDPDGVTPEMAPALSFALAEPTAAKRSPVLRLRPEVLLALQMVTDS